MQKKTPHIILYLITATLFTTIGVQFFWNYKNYKQNKQRLVVEIGDALNDAIEEYYAKKLKKRTIAIVGDSENPLNVPLKDAKRLLKSSSLKDTLSLIPSERIRGVTLLINKKKQEDKDTASSEVETLLKKKRAVQIYRKSSQIDSINQLQHLNAIVMSFTEEGEMDYTVLDSLLVNQFEKRNIKITYNFQHLKKDSILYEQKVYFENEDALKVVANSTFVKLNNTMQLFFKPPVFESLKRGVGGIVLSLLLATFIVLSLFYLLYIIRKQKQLSEMKNDLINNITHEFKTPITTVSTAIEAMENFRGLEDVEKTRSYLSISSEQLKKLHLMVEKLLETATLDSDKLVLQKEDTDLAVLLQNLIEKFSATTPKNVKYITNLDKCILNIDSFHLENALSNMIDNAIKYGGDTIEISLERSDNITKIKIADNGNGIKKQHSERIFDKFYRIPKGNTHNVKGFGIGLYYAKQIVEKHRGRLELSSKVNQTIFEITLFNG